MKNLRFHIVGMMLLAASGAHAGSIGAEYGRAGVEVGAIPTGNPHAALTPHFDETVRKLGVTGSANLGPVPLHLSLFRTGTVQAFVAYFHPDHGAPDIHVAFYTLDTRGARLTTRWTVELVDRVEFDLEGGVLHLRHRIRVDEFPPGPGTGNHDVTRTRAVVGAGVGYVVRPAFGVRLGGTVASDWHSVSVGVNFRF